MCTNSKKFYEVREKDTNRKYWLEVNEGELETTLDNFQDLLGIELDRNDIHQLTKEEADDVVSVTNI